MVLMMNPKVGLTVFTSSFINFFTIVVFPALSNPLPSCKLRNLFDSSSDSHSIKIRISLSFKRAFRRIDNIVPVVDVNSQGGRSEDDIKATVLAKIRSNYYHLTRSQP